MQLRSLALQDFRNYHSWWHEFTLPVTLIVGANAIGKTSIMEAIYLLATGQSFRAGQISEAIAFGAELGRVRGLVMTELETEEKAEGEDEVRPTQLEVTLTRGVVQGKRTLARLFAVNGVRRRRQAAVGLLTAVVFRPEDMRLIEGSPRRRRLLLDETLSQLHREYELSLKTYSEALIKYNKLLVAVREGQMPVTVLSFWSQQLVKHGQVLQTWRQRFVAEPVETELAAESLQFQLEFRPSTMSQPRMTEYQSRAIAAGHCLIGPHKDDFAVLIRPTTLPADQPALDVSIYGSRGQQRLAVLWLKLCQLRYLAQHTGRQPLLLLDDILSELDDLSRGYVIELLHHHQTLISTTDERVAADIASAKIKYETITFEAAGPHRRSYDFSHS